MMFSSTVQALVTDGNVWGITDVLMRKAKLHCVPTAILYDVYFSTFLDGLWTKRRLVKIKINK